MYHKRIGKPDQSAEKRPKFLLLHFTNPQQRDAVKRNAYKLRQISHLAHIRLKTILTRGEREKYTKAFKIRDQIVKEQPGRSVEFTKGTLYVDGEAVYSVRRGGAQQVHDDESLSSRTLT